MASSPLTTSRLRYLSSDHLKAPFPCDHADIRDREDAPIGALDGVIVDPTAHRVRFLVVDTGRQFGHYRFLLPFSPTEVDIERPVLHVDVDDAGLAECEPFDPHEFATFS